MMLQLFMRLASSLSCIFCFIVILLYLLYENISKKSYNKLIFYIALSDFFSAIGGLFGKSKNGTFNCIIQSILTNYFPLTSIFWTVVIAYLLFDILNKPNITRKKDTMIVEKWVHIICWGLPFLLTILPLTTTDYGTFDGEDGWCFLRPRHGSPKWTFRFWLFVAFFAWVYIAIILFFMFMLYVIYVIASPTGYVQTDSIIANTIKKAIRKLIWYPLIILVSWFSMTIYELWAGFHPNASSLHNTKFMYMTFIFPLLSGVMTSLAFYFGCSEAQKIIRTEWISKLIFCFGKINQFRKNSSLFSNNTLSSHTDDNSPPSPSSPPPSNSNDIENLQESKFQQISSSQTISPLTRSTSINSEIQLNFVSESSSETNKIENPS